MSNLNWLVCSVAFASLITDSIPASAQEFWNLQRNSNCGQTNAYPAATSPAYHNSRPSYSDYPQRDSYEQLPNHGVMQPYTGQDSSRGRVFYNRSVPSSYGYGDRQVNWEGASTSGFRRQNTSQVYDAVHGDYHSVPQTQLYQQPSISHSHRHSSTRDRYQFQGYSGW